MTSFMGFDVPHNACVTPTLHGPEITCSCGCRACCELYGAKEAKRLAFGHVAYPKSTLLELLIGPPCEAAAA